LKWDSRSRVHRRVLPVEEVRGGSRMLDHRPVTGITAVLRSWRDSS
jgi:hypothetical protein